MSAMNSNKRIGGVSKSGAPQWKRKALTSAIALTFAGMISTPAWSAACPASITGAVTGALPGCTTDGLTSITISNTGSVSAAVSTYSALATGIYVSGPLISASTISNSGAISATATGYYATAYGVYVNGDLAGSLTNSGSINVAAKATSDAYAYGVYVNGGLTGSLTNSGTINVTATSLTSDIYTAAGIYVNGDLAGSLTNSGTINVSAKAMANGSDAYAYGIYVNGSLTGSLTNSGTINVTATSLASDAYAATGIYINGDLAATGVLNNSGAISASATAYSYASARGISIGGDLAGSLINSGTIQATALSTSGGYATAYGVYVNGALSGTLKNSGKISATATNDSQEASAYGLYVSNGLSSGSLINSGTISATATGRTWAYAAGVLSYGTMTGLLDNSGAISATATSLKSEAEATALYVNTVGSTGVLTNSGSITASATAKYWAGAYAAFASQVDAGGTFTNSATGVITATATSVGINTYASAYGMGVWGTLAGTLTNAGSISASASADTWAGAYGVYVGNVAATGVLTNNGKITASATSRGMSSGASAYGVYFGWMNNGAVTNNGSISASASGATWASAYGVYRGNLSATGTFTNNGSITASATAIDWAGAYGVNPYYVDAGGTLTNSATGSITASARSTGMSSYASAYGVAVWWNMDGTLTNAGSISASASGATWASAYGVYANSVAASGVINNSGTISATATTTDGNASNSAYGVLSWTMDGTLNNSGSISGTADMPQNGYSLYLWSGSGTVNNLAGGLLSGNIYTGGTIAVNNAGTITIPPGAAGWINGNYTQQAGGVLGIGVTNVTTYGNLGVGGTADLTASNTINVKATPGAVLAAGDVLNNVLYASGGAGSLTLAAGTPVTVVGSPLFTYSGVVDATGGVDITVTSATTLAGVAGASGNASLNGIGGAVSALAAAYPTGTLDPLLVALYATSSAAELNSDLQELTPLMTGAMSLATLDVLHSTQRIIQSRQEANQGLSSGDLFYGDRRFWFKPFGSWADQSSRANIPGYKADTYGMAFGVDGEISKIARVGAAFTYAKTDVDSNESSARQNADIKTYQATVYGSYTLDEVTNLDWQADVGLHNNDGKRHIALLGGGIASSSYDSWSAHLGAGVSRAYKLNPQTTFIPTLRADYSRIRADGYTESGGPAPLLLNVQAETADELILAADAKFNHAMNESTTLFANLGAGYDTLSESASLTSTLAGGGAAFTTQGIDPSPWLARGGLGFTMKTGAAMEVTARYDIEARSDFTNQTASIRVNMPF